MMAAADWGRTHLAMAANFDGSADETMTTDAVSTNTASTIVARDANGVPQGKQYGRVAFFISTLA